MIEDGVSGILFSPRDAGACAAAVSRALAMGDAERAAMGKAAVARIAELCGNERVVRRRVELYGESGARPRSAGARGGARREVVVFDGGMPGIEPGRGRPGSPAEERLVAAVGDGDGIDFAHGWTSHGERVRVFGTPSLASLARGAREVGPVVVAREVAERVFGGRGVEGQSPWGVAVALCAAGCVGAVVPEVVTEVGPEPGEGAALGELVRRIEDLERGLRQWKWRAEVAERELARIRGSHGWGVLQRVYAVLHVLKGRGLARGAAGGGSYHGAGNEATESGGGGRNQIA
jgi:hypothetical protein